MINIVLWVAGFVLLALGIAKAAGPFGRMNELDRLADNAKRYESWRGGSRLTAADNERTGADVMRDLMRRRRSDLGRRGGRWHRPDRGRICRPLGDVLAVCMARRGSINRIGLPTLQIKYTRPPQSALVSGFQSVALQPQTRVRPHLCKWLHGCPRSAVASQWADSSKGVQMICKRTVAQLSRSESRQVAERRPSAMRRCSTRVQRSMTTGRPASCAMRAASQLTMPS